jgi:flagellar hook-associated protein 1
MAGLFDTLALGSRSLQTYRKAIDTTGHNLANVNTPGYTRQRLVVESVTNDSDIGAAGSGAEATRIVGLRNEFAQKQLQVESSLEGSLEIKDEALRQALTALQENIDRTSEGGTSTNGISQDLTDFFASVQNLSLTPGSDTDRAALLQKAVDLAAKFNDTDRRLGDLEKSLNERVTGEVANANTLLGQIAELNQKIAIEENGSDSIANDLRDTRQSRIEDLARIVKLEAVEQANGTTNIIVGGQTLVDGIEVAGTLETFSSADSKLLVRVSDQEAPLNLGAGILEGAISARDGQLDRVRGEINDLAATIITEVNAVHSTGFGKEGTTGAAFFTGTNASDIGVNRELVRKPSLLQASSVADAEGNNTKILALVDLEKASHAALGGKTFFDKYAQTVSTLGHEVASARTDLEDQQAMTRLVKGQRDSVSAVSVDEEMANMVMFQKAFQASAKLISMTDEMLATIIGM